MSRICSQNQVLRHPHLEDIPKCACLMCRFDKASVRLYRANHNCCAECRMCDLPGDLDSIEAGHGDIQNCDFRLGISNQSQSRVPISSSSDYIEVPLQSRHYCREKRWIVVGSDDARLHVG